MHRTPGQWKEMKPSAVLAGSEAQRLNVMEMMQADIVKMGRALSTIAAENLDEDACHELAHKTLRVTTL